MTEHEVVERGVTGDERGAGSVLTATVMLVLAVVVGAIFVASSWIGCIHRLRSAADLSAIAAAEAYSRGAEPCSVGRQTAQLNGTQLIDCTVESNGIDFIVQVKLEIPASPIIPGGPTKFAEQAQAGQVEEI